MVDLRQCAPPGRVLVSDFDGTMTRHDFYKLAIELLLPPETPDYWAAYRDGTITHFEALRSYFAAIRASEDEVLAVVNRMELDPELPAAVASLRRAGWSVVVTSAGCDWYIRKLLATAGVDVEVHANPGRFVAGQGLLMEMPAGSPFWSATLGVDKAAVVRRYLEEGRTVGFAGDGFPDAEAARLVPADLRFARSDLAAVLRSDGLPFRAYETWSDIADALLQGGL
jgi:2,3-diketo-5-methylthio-1-phosphopentane phosphatase